MATNPVATPEAGAMPASGSGPENEAQRQQADYVRNMAAAHPAMRDAAAPDTENTVERGPERGRATIDGKVVSEVRYSVAERPKDADKNAADTYELRFFDGRKEVGQDKVSALYLDSVVGAENAATIREGKARGTLKGDTLAAESGWTWEGLQSRKPKEPAAEVDVREALDEAARRRARDRADVSAGREGLFQESEAELHRVRRLDVQGRALDVANDTAERTGRPANDDQQASVELEKNRRIDMMQTLRSEYRVDGKDFYFKDRPNKVAFREDGQKLKTATNDQRVARAMATMAYAQGWKTIQVNGHHEFKREVWMQASLHGLTVEGYTPKPEDVQELRAAREREMRNSIVHAPERTREGAQDQQRASERERTRSEPPPAVAARESHPDAEKRPQTPAERVVEATAAVAKAGVQKAAARVFTGLLVEHGAAKYNNDKDEAPSYFVKLATASGIRTMWGKDLERAVTEGGAKTGEAVRLVHQGDKPVTVEAVKRNDKGKAIGHETIDTKRNSWDLRRDLQHSDERKLVEGVAHAVVTNKFKDANERKAVLEAINARAAEREAAGTLPKPKVYDTAAPSKAAEHDRARPAVERNAERTR